MVKIVQNSFLGGQLDFEMMGRQDVDKYSKGATVLKNFVPLKRGAIRKRPGTDFRHDVTARIGTGRHRLVPFAYTQDEGWALLFTDGQILAFSASQTVEVTNVGASFYSGSQIDELDYCQCGDVLYIAHQTHQPCRIEHRVSGGVHSFTLKAVDPNTQAYGIPSIIGAKVSKTGITVKGPTVTESYKVTAVFDGVETFPSEAYADSNCADYDTGYDAWQAYLKERERKDKIVSQEYQPALKTYSGTSYTSPWTTSQKITLKVKPATRVAADGITLEYPDQIRIYRKTGSLYGLVGYIDTSAMNGSDSATVQSGVTATYSGTESKGNGIADAVSCGAYGWGCDGFLVTGLLTLTLPAAAKRATVSITPGSVVATETTETYDDDGEEKTRLASITYTYRPCLASRFTVRLGGGSARSVTLVSSSANKTLTVSREDGDSDEGLRLRGELAVSEWLSGFSDTASAAVEVTASTASTALVVSADTASFIVSNVRVRAYAEQPQSLTWDDKYYTPDVSLTPPTHELFMNEAGEYPACVCLSQQRLIWASSLNDPSRVIMSQTGNFDTYAPHDAMVDDDPIDFMISATRFPKVNHIVELRKLLMFNGDAEWVVDSASAASGITYATIQARQHSSIGAAPWLKPIVCNNVLLFAERTGQAVRQYGYQLEDDGYGGEDVSIFSASLFRERRIVSWAFQQHPHSTCWCVLSDGTLCSLTFMREQQTIAWASHELGGGGRAREIVCTHAVTGNQNAVADTSQLFVLVWRAVDSGPGYTWSIEEFRHDCRHGSDTVPNALCLDSMRTLGSGDAIRSGAAAFDPATGQRAATAAVGLLEGFPFESVFTSVYPVVRDEVGMAQMDVKCVQEAHLRMADAVGGTVRAVDVPAGQASALVKTVKAVVAGGVGSPGTVSFGETIDENVPLVTGNNRDGRITVVQDEPWPFTLLMLETDVECEIDEGRRR